jgi:anti-sigma regulatory factor (Ser/Thr protein kinase)
MITIADHIMDIVQNSVSAEATLIEIIVEEDKKNDLYSLKINDNGCGMDKEILKQTTNPFFTSRKTRKVGLGIPLLKQHTEQTGGKFTIESETGKGTKVIARFKHASIDRQPLGDISETLYMLLLAYANVTWVYEHRTEYGKFEFNSADVKNALGNVSLQQKEIRTAICELIDNNLEDIKATK